MLKKISAFCGALLLPVAVHAQNFGYGSVQEAAIKFGGYRATTIEDTIGEIIKMFLTLVGMIFLILMVYGGYTWMIASGDEGKVDKAKETITRAIIGLGITLAAYSITYFVTYWLSKNSLSI